MVKQGSITLHHLLDAIISIEDIIGGDTRESFSHNTLKIQASLSLLIHIGELLNALQKYHNQFVFSGSDSIRGMRNILAHQYLSIRKGYIIKALFDYLPILKQEALEYLRQNLDNYEGTKIMFEE